LGTVKAKKKKEGRQPKEATVGLRREKEALSEEGTSSTCFFVEKEGGKNIITTVRPKGRESHRLERALRFKGGEKRRSAMPPKK